jgi:hypothetical protein
MAEYHSTSFSSNSLKLHRSSQQFIHKVRNFLFRARTVCVTSSLYSHAQHNVISLKVSYLNTFAIEIDFWFRQHTAELFLINL